ncbi:uncharacterized protein LOC125949860 [Anopheles darlingi]|uniref:uncharacterized protein LOC125949860 n=1 Tax=Anopheles darlingi TaxID=43151 RepID=UPI0021003AF5|nr:uncharacterized protein LOC125949860 [Anopheles darlingi]
MALRNVNDNEDVGSRRLVLWTRALIFRLIDALREEPMLWNQQHPNFKLRSKKKVALMKIARDLQLPVPAVRQKIDVLKGTFHKYRRALQARGGDLPEKTWFAYERLMFLAPDDQSSIASNVVSVKMDEEEETTYSIAYNIQENRRETIPPRAYDSPPSPTKPSRLRSRLECSQTAKEKLVQVIDEGTNRKEEHTWPNVLAATVGLMVRQAGPRSEPEMWRLQDSLIQLMRRFHKGEFAEDRLHESTEEIM